MAWYGIFRLGIQIQGIMKDSVNIVLQDDLHIRLDTRNYEYLNKVKDHFTELVDGYMFMPLYKSGRWNGKKSLFNPNVRRLPYGLLTDLMKFTKDEFPDLTISADDDVKQLFKGMVNPDPTWKLKYYPYPYQEECICTALKYSKGLFSVVTAGGKSLIIAYVIKELLKENIKNCIIIVPTAGLVEQFYSDLLDYGMYPELLGKVDAKHKDFDKQIVISTWQSLQRRKTIMGNYDCVIIDEVHSAKATQLNEILKHAVNADYRYGFTGTIPKCRLDELTVRSYLGPVLKTFTAKDLADEGYISHCTINMLRVNYDQKPSGDYHAVREYVFQSKYRLGLIKHLCEKTDHTALILVDKIKEGELLEETLSEKFPDRDVIFISGRDKTEIRETWRQVADKQNNVIIIATYPIFQMGVNIPSLRTLIFASPSKSYIRIIQSIGRTLRLHADKEDVGAIIWDIVDNVKYLNKHSEIRHRHYMFEKHNVNEYSLQEGGNFHMELLDE